MMKNTSPFKYLMVVLAIHLTFVGQSQDAGLFDTEEVLDLEMYVDLQKLMNDVGEEREYHNGLLILNSNEGELSSFDLELKTRGNFRRRADVCSFPPLKVNLEKDQIKNTVFAGADKRKLVSHCNTDDRDAEDYLLSEYLAYKIFNQFTNLSHRVRLAEIEYHDILQRQSKIKRHAFFIEDDDELAERCNMESLDLDKINPEDLSRDQFHLYVVFQFLIGNTDWSVLLPKNTTILSTQKEDTYYVIPYDFDLAYLVKPSYRFLNPGIDSENNAAKIKTYCGSLEDFNTVIKLVISKKPKILEMIKNFDLVGGKQKRHMLEVLNKQFDILENSEKAQEYFENYCND